MRTSIGVAGVQPARWISLPFASNTLFLPDHVADTLTRVALCASLASPATHPMNQFAGTPEAGE